jgi:RsiW-degrading membrane proteinase PrsW (M82 family)
MYCPKCAQPQVTEETQFCSHCGLSLINLKEMVLAEGKAKFSQSESKSPRQKGVRQGVMLMLLSVILIPAYILLAALFPANDRLVESAVSDTPFEKISQAILLTIFILGLARMLYARFFQESNVVEETDMAQLRGSAANHLLPPAQGTPVSSFGSWRANTGEIAQPSSVSEHTTKSLG